MPVINSEALKPRPALERKTAKLKLGPVITIPPVDGSRRQAEDSKTRPVVTPPVDGTRKNTADLSETKPISVQDLLRRAFGIETVDINEKPPKAELLGPIDGGHKAKIRMYDGERTRQV